jgi:hypothetical protein
MQMTQRPGRRPVSVGRLLWLRASLLTGDRAVPAICHAPAEAAGRWLIYLYSADGYEHGVLNWRECEQCQRGVIAKMSLGSDWQHRGIGRLLPGGCPDTEQSGRRHTREADRVAGTRRCRLRPWRGLPGGGRATALTIRIRLASTGGRRGASSS